MPRLTRPATVAEALKQSGRPITVDEICAAMFGKTGQRERNRVYVSLHRLDERGAIEKTAATYRLKDPIG